MHPRPGRRRPAGDPLAEWESRYAQNHRPFGEEPTPFVRDVFRDPVTHGIPAPSPTPRSARPDQPHGRCTARPEGPGGDPARILCPGDGYGRNGVWLAQLGYRVTGLELVAAAVSDARRRARAAHADYRAIEADLSELPIPLAGDESFDAIVSAWVRLPRGKDRVAWNRECRRRLRPGGAVVIVAGAAVTDPAAECDEWPADLSWSDHSTREEVRLIGRVPGTRAPCD